MNCATTALLRYVPCQASSGKRFGSNVSCSAFELGPREGLHDSNVNLIISSEVWSQTSTEAARLFDCQRDARQGGVKGYCSSPFCCSAHGQSWANGVEPFFYAKKYPSSIGTRVSCCQYRKASMHRARCLGQVKNLMQDTTTSTSDMSIVPMGHDTKPTIKGPTQLLAPQVQPSFLLIRCSLADGSPYFLLHFFTAVSDTQNFRAISLLFIVRISSAS